MRILHFIPTLATGGAERQLYLLCRETCGRIEHTVIAAASEGRWARPLRELGLEVRCLGSALRDPRLLLRMRREVSRVSPEIVHCWLPSMNVAGALISGSAPMVASVRNVDDWKPWFYRLTERLLSPLWNAVIANSEAGAAEIARTAKLADDRLYVVLNGIAFRPVKPRPAGAERTVLTACRLVPQKRVDRVLAAARRLPDFRFRIAGAGPERLTLEQGAPPNVEFLGEIADLSREYDDAALFMLTSEREGTSNALLEAMQAGCVPVVTAAGDNARIVRDGFNGRVAQDDALAGAVRDCVANWTLWSGAARECAERYSVPAMAERTLEIYRSLDHATAAHSLPRLH